MEKLNDNAQYMKEILPNTFSMIAGFSESEWGHKDKNRSINEQTNAFVNLSRQVRRKDFNEKFMRRALEKFLTEVETRGVHDFVRLLENYRTTLTRPRTGA